MKRALLALESAREINDNPEILPSYEVFLIYIYIPHFLALELMILNSLVPKYDSSVVMPCWMIRLFYFLFSMFYSWRE